MASWLAGWHGTPLPEWMGSWWMIGIVAAAVSAVAWWSYRSIRRWRQGPPGRDDAALKAEEDLRWLTYRNMPG
jgi:hypothetical protein